MIVKQAPLDFEPMRIATRWSIFPKISIANLKIRRGVQKI